MNREVAEVTGRGPKIKGRGSEVQGDKGERKSVMKGRRERAVKRLLYSNTLAFG